MDMCFSNIVPYSAGTSKGAWTSGMALDILKEEGEQEQAAKEHP
jgi:hypothetical protein